MNEEAALGPLGLTLLSGMVVAISVGAAIVAENARDQATPEAIEEREAHARERDGAYEVSLVSGSPVAMDDGIVRLRIDGDDVQVPLSWWQEHVGATWDLGEWICIAGPGPECYGDDASRMEASVIADGTFLADLGPVVSFDPDQSAIVRYEGRRPSFHIEYDGGILVQCTTEATLDIIGVEITHGPGGDDIPVYVQISTTGSAPYQDVFGGEAVTSADAYALGEVHEGAVLGLWARAASGGFDEAYSSFQDDPHVLVLADGDEGPALTPYGDQIPVSELLGPYVDAGGFITLEPGEVIILVEFNPDLDSAAADFQDLVAIYAFEDVDC